MKNFLYSILLLSVVILSGCSKDEKVTEFLKVTSGLTYTVEAAGGTVNVSVETNTDYFVSIPDDAKNWISVVGSRATMQDVFSLSITANSTASRTAKISLKNKSGEVLANIQISQEVQTIKITDGATYEVDPAGEIINVNLETNTDYSVSIPDEAKEWICVVESRSTRQETITLNISANTDKQRVAKLSFTDKYGASLASIQISQDVQEVKYLKITDGATYDIDPTGETINVNLETNTEYMVSIPDEAKDWISVVESRSTRQETITLNISANTDKQRIAKLLFIEKSGETLASIQISQEAQSFKITSGSTYNVDVDGGNVEIYIETNLDYLISIPEDAKDWVNIVESQAGRRDVVTLQISKNEGDTRSTVIHFFNNKGVTLSSIEVNQEKGEIDAVDPTDPSTIPSDMTKAFPDKIFRDYVILKFDRDWNGIISEEEALNVKKIDVNNKQISSLKGIQYFSNLENLDCSWNVLTSLDVSKNTALTELECQYNQLTSLDVSKSTSLIKLNCAFNQLTSLDISKNTALTNLSCLYNHLSSLDVSKNIALTYLTCDLNQLISLDVSQNTALTYLTCGSNQLTSLDVSKNTALTKLQCHGNQLTSLDVSKNTELERLWCYSNQLTSLDVSKNTALTELSCDKNELTSLDVSKNTALTKLYCYDNQLTSLDVSKNTALTKLWCWDNQLTTLDLSKNTVLTELDCRMSTLQTLYVKKGFNFFPLKDSNTKIIYVD